VSTIPLETLALASRDEHLSGPVMNPSTNVPQAQPAARRQVEFLKRQLWLIVLVVVAALAAAAGTSIKQPKVYRASSKIFVGPSGTLNPQFGNTIQAFTQTMSSLLVSDIVAKQVIGDLGLNQTTENVLGHLHVSSTPDSAVLQVSYDSQNRAEALRILAKVGSVFTALVQKKLAHPSAPNALAVTATVFDPAHASTTPISPHPAQTLAFAGIIGLVLGIVFALLRDTLDERIHKRDEMEELFGAPVIAALPKSMLGRAVVDTTRRLELSHLHAIEPLRLQLARVDSREQLITITSGGSGEGKSTVAASIGVALALAGEDVICVDVAPDKHGLSHYLSLASGDGVPAAPLEGLVDVPNALREVRLEATVEKAGLEAIPSPQAGGLAEFGHGLPPAIGHGGRGRLQLLVLGEGALTDQDGFPSWSIADLVTDLKSQAGFVVVDAPALPSAATFAVLSVSDTVIVVAREARTTKEQARSVRNAVETLQVPSYAVVSIGRTATPVPSFGRTRTGPTHAFSSKRERRDL
jgi:capsular polysaccharide biosynthesis protein/MinD-like ATPase involved in chromosome partitioning or flagellar assembly